jgi:hypothetical protein
VHYYLKGWRWASVAWTCLSRLKVVLAAWVNFVTSVWVITAVEWLIAALGFVGPSVLTEVVFFTIVVVVANELKVEPALTPLTYKSHHCS